MNCRQNMKIVKIGLLLFALLAGALLVYAIFGLRNIANRQQAVAEAWRQTAGMTPAELIQSYPKTEKNEAARRLETLAAKLEVAAENETATDADAGSIIARDYFADRPSDDGDRVEELPENVKNYLAAHQNDLNRLYESVRQNPPPEWEADANQSRAMLPSHASLHIRLHEIIALDALDKTARKQDRQALEALEASWKASEFLRRRPEALFQTINSIVSTTQNNVLRKIKDVPAEWRERLQKPDYRALAAQSLELEFAAASLEIEPKSATALQKVRDNLLPPFESAAALNQSEAGQETVAQFQSGGFCAFDSSRDGEAKIVWWNPKARIMFPATHQIWRNFAVLLYDRELTEQVLRVREIERAAAQTGSLPQFAAIDSALCDGSRWIIERQNDGSLVVRFDKAKELFANQKAPSSYKLHAER